MLARYLIVLVLTAPFHAYAETAKPGYTLPSSVISTENMMQMATSLLLVLVIIGTLAWLLKRFAINPSSASSAIKIIATTSVGQRERIVLIEVEDTRLVLGVTPGRVNILHCMDQSSEKKSRNKLPELATDKFPEQLSQSIKKNL
ncbi:MAG: flagellar biosynthetic protein FliO [Nitrosomonas sp.]|nr:flagellar biosynthetic protein FliO [Nitrosomonas sp.]MDP1949762.1 flagellar biosynthetic protein FliO [Nitrosomonas sp.]